jgi:hypothetical protein
MKLPRYAAMGYAALALAVLAAQTATAQVTLTDATRKNLQIEVTPLASSTIQKRWAASVEVIDPAPMIAQLRDIHAAEVQATSSRNEAERLARLHQADSNVSLKAAEAARATAASDGAKLDALRAQWASSYGRGLVDLNDAQRERLGTELLAGKISIARAETLEPVADPRAFKSARIRRLVGDASWDARVLGATATASQSVGTAIMLEIPAMLPAGTLLSGELVDRTATLQGLKVPRSAVVRWQGSEWVYVETQPNTFERVILKPVAWVEDGCLVQQGLEPGSKVVSAGAAMLLAAENQPAEHQSGTEN